MNKPRQAIVLILLFVTLIVGGIAVYVGIQLQQQPDVTPEDTSALVPGDMCPDGSGQTISNCLIFLCPNGCGPDNGCGSSDDGATVYAGDCGTLGNRCGQSDLVWGGANNDVSRGTYCGIDAITCEEAICEPPKVQCGGACTTSGDCRDELTCSGGTCVVPGCIEHPEICQADLCTPTAPQCGQVCYDNSAADWHDCPSGQGCANADANGIGTCKILGCIDYPNLCNTNGCSAVTPQCGDQCYDGPADWTSCPTGQTCAELNSDFVGTCVRDECLSNPALCNSNRCNLLPSPSPSPSPSPTPTITTTPTVVLVQCGSECTGSGDCESPLVCTDHDNDGTQTCVIAECQDNDPLCTNNGCVLGEPSPSPSPTVSLPPGQTVVPTLPGTALVNDETDAILLGALMLFTGIMFYVLGLHFEIGKLFWDNGVSGLFKTKKHRDAESKKFEDSVLE